MAKRMARPASIAFAGGYGCKNPVRDVKTRDQCLLIHTRPIASPKGAVVERVNNIDTILSNASMILLVRMISPDARVSRLKIVMIDLVELQLWSCTASGCLANIIPVVRW
jgi:hypothetical protein